MAWSVTGWTLRPTLGRREEIPRLLRQTPTKMADMKHRQVKESESESVREHLPKESDVKQIKWRRRMSKESWRTDHVGETDDRHIGRDG